MVVRRMENSSRVKKITHVDVIKGLRKREIFYKQQKTEGIKCLDNCYVTIIKVIIEDKTRKENEKTTENDNR